MQTAPAGAAFLTDRGAESVDFAAFNRKASPVVLAAGDV